MAGELQIVSRVYDLILWTLNHTSKFPRDHRFTLGTRLEDALYGLLDDVLEAKFTQQKADILRRAALRLEKIRFQFRLAKDLHIVALSSHRHACSLVDDIGRQVGAWRRSVESTAARLEPGRKR